MSQYENFVTDFPSRCAEILDRYDHEASIGGREVTLMLAVATSGFSIPFARLRPDNQGGAVRDRADFPDAQRQFDALLSSRFLESELGRAGQTWSFGTISDPSAAPDAWPELATPARMTRLKTVGSVLKHLRNGLAHGNVVTRLAANGPASIGVLVFLVRPAEDAPRFNYIAVTPADFIKFLRAWFTFLRTLPLPAGLTSGIDARAV